MELATDVVVLGAGVGGTAIAGLLAHAGLHVTLLEKNPMIGGSCASYRRDGFTVDYGTHMFSRGDRGPLNEALRQMEWPERLEFCTAPVLFRIRGLGLDTLIPSTRWLLPPVAIWTLLQTGCSHVDLRGVLTLIRDLLFLDERQIDALDAIDLATYLEARLPNPRLRVLAQMIFGTFFVTPTDHCATGEAIWCLRRILAEYTIGYPRGGAGRIPALYARAAVGRGAIIETGVCITRVDVEGGIAIGVTAEDGRRWRAATVVSTLPLQTTISLAGPQHFPAPYVARVAKTTSSLLAVQVKLGLSRPLIRSGCLIGGLPLQFSTEEDIRSTLCWTNAVEAGDPRFQMFYCPVPSNFDPDLAPAGKQLLLACTVAPTTRGANGAEGRLHAALTTLVPGLAEATEWVDIVGAEELGSFLGKQGVISTAQVVGQVGRDRPDVTTPLPGLFLAGDCAGARGIGVELAAASAMVCAQRVVDAVRHGQLSRAWTSALHA
ncbi:MAG: phytoene desaturase family protein [Candidatus Polarisedimenticolia bacterium]